MILFDGTGAARYGIHFFHEKKPVALPNGHVIERRTAFATIHRGPCATKDRPCGTDGAVMASASCNHKDDYHRPTGRKVAMARAMSMLGMERDERTLLWNMYLERIGVLTGHAQDPG